MVGPAHGFFSERRPIGADLGDEDARLIGYKNLPQTIGVAVSGKMATLIELGTVYGLRDLYDMLEIMTVDAHNRRALMPKGD